ncbi:MAG: hypothetical protein L3J65_03235 [Robiginitomaculum sp.]|nr:hypothetical protein [Robiginitomaculum sp.]
MCLSASVSFIAAGALTTGGAFAVWRAWTINKRYLPIALMPIFAGIQQFMEGHVWMGLNAGTPDMIWWAAMGFILFSWLMWPTWVPFAMYFLEPPGSKRKKPLMLFALAGLIFGLTLYIPHLFNPDWVQVKISNKSITYEDTMLLDYIIPRWGTYAIYMVLLIIPPMLSTYKHMRIFGMTMIAVVVIVWAFFSYANISFFCLLAGAATLHLIYIIVNNKCCRECPELFS